MKKFVTLTFLFASLCVVGCSGEKAATKIQSGGGSTSTTIEKK